ncbi:glutaredoxin family protein [soil metagenome]|jgi:thiol-disulfide isomerase/thioredoxin|nr:glutaredoxin family protein [Actinomycetota bacterium]
MKTVTLLTRVGCHLCEQARPVLVDVCAETGARLLEVDVDTDPDLRAEYGDRLPVFLVDGREHGYLRVEPARLRAALTG